MYYFHKYPTRHELDKALATVITNRLKQAITLRDEASLVVSGGKTPLHLFDILSIQPVTWSKVNITLVDERWVNDMHTDSNAHLVKIHLLKNKAKAANFISLKNAAKTPYDGATETENLLKEKIRLPFDVVVLGMGDDGHTASLFPLADNLTQGLDEHSRKWVIPITPKNAPYQRLTLTLPLILSSRYLYLHIVGEQKRRVLNEALSGADKNSMPIRAVLNQYSKPVNIYWAR